MFMLRVIAVGALVVWSALAAGIDPRRRAARRAIVPEPAVHPVPQPERQGRHLRARSGAPRRSRLHPVGDGQPDVESRAGDVGRDEAAGRPEGQHDSGTGRRPVRLLRVRPLFRKARRRGARQAGLCRQALRRLPRHHQFARSGRAAGGEMGIARRPGRSWRSRCGTTGRRCAPRSPSGSWPGARSPRRN